MKIQSYKYVFLNELDSVVVSLENIPKGEVIKISYKNINKEIRLLDSIDFGHKLAIKDINKGDPIIKYGEVIGGAIRNIKSGEHVHVHNLEGRRGRGDKIVKKA